MTVSCREETIAVTGITLKPETIVMKVGETAKLYASLIPENASERTVFWSSDDESVVTVDQGIVTALDAGAATIYAGTLDGGYVATCPVNVRESGIAVDLGLSVKWADTNIGADSPSKYGAYFTWGDIQGKTSYNWETYGWGRKWRTPTYDEFMELFDSKKCTISWDPFSNGLIIKSKSTHGSIFLSAAGRRDGKSTVDADKSCCYWTSTACPEDPGCGRYILCSDGQSFTDEISRDMCLPVRAVAE